MKPWHLSFTAAALVASAGFAARGQCPWSGQASGPGPSLHNAEDFVYDTGRGRLVLYQSGETWEWDGSVWLLRATGGPAPTSWNMAYDAARARTVLYGGAISTPPYTSDQTWEWDGQTWTLAAATGPGISNYGTSMVFDAHLQRVTQVRKTPTTDSSFWDWNGTAWVQRSGPGLPNVPWMVYDTNRSRIVALCNDASYQYFQTWEYDSAGGVWILRVGQGTPHFDALAFDPVRGKAVGYGGAGPDPTYSYEIGRNTWEYDGTAGSWTLISNGRPDGFRSSGAFYDTAHSRWTMLTLRNPNYEMEFWTYSPGGLPGLLITQQPESLSLTPGQTGVFHIAATGAGALSFHWRRNNQFLEDGGIVSGTRTSTLTIGPVTRADEGTIDVQITDSCGSTFSRKGALGVYVPCYANCDNSTAPPMLNANDFQCFLNIFAAGCSTPNNCYVNCDNSTVQPFLNANDFQCFLNAYAAGCT